MECEEVKIKLIDDFIKGKMKYFKFLDISKHLEKCNGCLKEYQYLKRINYSIKNLNNNESKQTDIWSTFIELIQQLKTGLIIALSSIVLVIFIIIVIYFKSAQVTLKKCEISTINKVKQTKALPFENRNEEPIQNPKKIPLKKNKNILEEKPLEKYLNKKFPDMNYRKLGLNEQLNQFDVDKTLDKEQKHIIIIDIKF